MPYDPLLPLDSIDVGERFRKDLGDLDELATSIAAIGLLHPITVLPGKRSGRWLLVAGERRLRACQRLGMDRIAARVLADPAALLRAEHDENMVREPFAPSEAVAIAAALMPAAKAAARERMAEAGKGGQIAQPSRAADDVARAVGMSRRTLDAATEVVEAAAEHPTLAPLVEHMDETGKVEPAHRALKALPADPTPEQVKAALASREAALPPEHLAEERANAARLAWLDTWSGIRKAITKSPPSVVEVLEREDIEDLPEQLAQVRGWLDAVEERMRDGRRPRLVGGIS